MKTPRLPLLVLATGCAAGCANPTNEPQYVDCAPMGAAPNDVCRITATPDANDMLVGVGSLHVPVKPESAWKASDRKERTDLQKKIDPSGAIVVPVYRLEHYDLSVEWHVVSTSMQPSKFKVDLDGANEEIAYDPSAIMVGDPKEDPPAPPLTGDVPYDIGPMGTVDGVFREDQLREAAIDLDQITRGNINPFAATLTINKNASSFQPVTTYDPTTMTGGDPTGPAIPEAAFRQFVRVDIRFRPDIPDMTLTYTLRVREHYDVIDDKGLNAPASELNILDPAVYSATLP